MFDVTLTMMSMLDFVFKCFGMLGVLAILAMFVLWPINDQPVNKLQWTIYGILNVIGFLLIFGFININVG